MGIHAGVTYTSLRGGQAAWQVDGGPGVVFDVDAGGHILGAHTTAGADWVGVLVEMAQAGMLTVEVPEVEDSNARVGVRHPG